MTLTRQTELAQARAWLSACAGRVDVCRAQLAHRLSRMGEAELRPDVREEAANAAFREYRNAAWAYTAALREWEAMQPRARPVTFCPTFPREPHNHNASRTTLLTRAAQHS